MDDTISRQAAIDELNQSINIFEATDRIKDLPSAQPERLTDDDFETIRIHLNTYKEKLCNQQRWKEAEEYQRIIDRFIAFASAQRKGKWIVITDNRGRHAECPFCGEWKYHNNQKFCGECSAELKGEEDEVN